MVRNLGTFALASRARSRRCCLFDIPLLREQDTVDHESCRTQGDGEDGMPLCSIVELAKADKERKHGLE